LLYEKKSEVNVNGPEALVRSDRRAFCAWRHLEINLLGNSYSRKLMLARVIGQETVKYLQGKKGHTLFYPKI